MCSRFGPVLGLIVVAALAAPPAAHASDERRSPRVGSVAITQTQVSTDFQGQASSPGQPKPDSLANGAAIGALIGAATGLGLMGWAYNQCDDTCDAPEPLPMYLMAGGVGAAAGAVVGLVVDAAKKNTTQRVSVAGVVTPKRSQVSVTLRF